MGRGGGEVAPPDAAQGLLLSAGARLASQVTGSLPCLLYYGGTHLVAGRAATLGSNSVGGNLGASGGEAQLLHRGGSE